MIIIPETECGETKKITAQREIETLDKIKEIITHQAEIPTTLTETKTEIRAAVIRADIMRTKETGITKARNKHQFL